MKQYFENEMHYLRDSGRRFAQRHPLQAGHLGATGRDPDVERLLEGFAFLTARLQQQADAWVPTLTEQLAYAISPDILAPLPSATIVQIHPQSRIARPNSIIPRGTQMKVTNIDGEDIIFSTMEDCIVSPLDRIESRIERCSSQSYKITLRCFISPQYTFHHLLKNRTRFFICGNFSQSSNLLLSIINHTDKIYLTMGKKDIHLLPKQHISYLDLKKEPSILGRTSKISYGSAAMRDYLLHPERFCFFDFNWPNEDQIRSLGLRSISCEHFDLTFMLKDPPTLPTHIDSNDIRIHCIPAVNIFESSSIPIAIDSLSEQRLIRPEQTSQIDNVLVHSVLHAESTSLSDGSRQKYVPHAQMTQQLSNSNSGYYVLHRKQSPYRMHSDIYISIHHLEMPPNPLEERILSLQLLCTNHHRASHIPSNTRVRIESIPGIQSAVTMTPTSLACDALFDMDTVWLLLGQMRQLRSFSDPAEQIRQRIELLCHTRQLDTPRKQAKQARISGISQLNKENTHRILNGVPQACTKWNLSLASDRFASEGDAYIFAHIVEMMLSDYISFNQPYNMDCQIFPSNTRYQWDTRIW